MTDDSLFAFAGLWERWRDPAGFIETFTIAPLPNPIRWLLIFLINMPVILNPEDYDPVVRSRHDRCNGRWGISALSRSIPD